MAMLVRLKLFKDVLLNGLGAVESGVKDLRYFQRAEALYIQATSILGIADLKVEYAVSPDGVLFGSYDDFDDIVASTETEFASPAGFTPVPMPNMLAGFVKFKATGINLNPADTLITIDLVMRENA